MVSTRRSRSLADCHHLEPAASGRQRRAAPTVGQRFGGGSRMRLLPAPRRAPISVSPKSTCCQVRAPVVGKHLLGGDRHSSRHDDVVGNSDPGAERGPESRWRLRGHSRRRDHWRARAVAVRLPRPVRSPVALTTVQVTRADPTLPAWSVALMTTSWSPSGRACDPHRRRAPAKRFRHRDCSVKVSASAALNSCEGCPSVAREGDHCVAVGRRAVRPARDRDDGRCRITGRRALRCHCRRGCCGGGRRDCRGRGGGGRDCRGGGGGCCGRGRCGGGRCGGGRRGGGRAVVGAAVVGATVVGAAVVGATVVGAAVVGATVVGAAVVGATVVGATVVGGRGRRCGRGRGGGRRCGRRRGGGRCGRSVRRPWWVLRWWPRWWSARAVVVGAAVVGAAVVGAVVVGACRWSARRWSALRSSWARSWWAPWSAGAVVGGAASVTREHLDVVPVPGQHVGVVAGSSLGGL